MIIKPNDKEVAKYEESTIEGTGIVDAQGNKIVKTKPEGCVTPFYAAMKDAGRSEDGLVSRVAEDFVWFEGVEEPEEIRFRDNHPILYKAGVGIAAGIAGLALGGIIMCANPGEARADFKEAIKMPKDSVNFELITAWYAANHLRLLDGSTKNINLDKVVGNMGLYLRKEITEKFDFMTYGVIPVGHVQNTAIDQESSGIGDLTLTVGGQLTFDNLTFLMTLDAMFPTGDYDKDRIVNMGKDQYGVGVGLRATSTHGRYVQTSGVIYNHMFGSDGRGLDTDGLMLRHTSGYAIVPNRFVTGVECVGVGNFTTESGKASCGPIAALITKAGMFTITYAPDFYSKGMPQGQLMTLRYRKAVPWKKK